MRCLTPDECRAWRKENVSRREWKRQLTCETPLKRLPWFTGECVRHLTPFKHALLIVDQVVFDHPALGALRREHGEFRSIGDAPGHLLNGDAEALQRALEVVLSGWVDFRVLFSPSDHALVANHDEFTTFFSTSSGRIAAVRDAMKDGGLRIYPEYAPGFP